MPGLSIAQSPQSPGQQAGSSRNTVAERMQVSTIPDAGDLRFASCAHSAIKTCRRIRSTYSRASAGLGLTDVDPTPLRVSD
jgi:hypothetical protein